MKKISNSCKNIFRPIIKFFDKWLITPITKLILMITDYLKSNDKGIEKILNNRQALVIISLIFALIAFYAIDREGVSLVDDNAEMLYGIPVTPVYNYESYVVEGLPEKVDVTLIGKKWNVYLAKQYPGEAITVDLSDLSPGTHKVDLNYKQNVSSVTYKVDPSTITVVVYKKMSDRREVTADIIHLDNLDSKLNVESVTLNKDQVTIKGPEYKLNQVASVKALVDIDNLPNQDIGNHTLTDVKLVAYDSNGNVVDVEIVPGTLKAEVVISSPHKTVPVKIEHEGELDGKAIKSLTSNVEEVTLYGSKEALDKINYFTVSIDITGINTDKNYTVNVTNPPGIREISVKIITVKLVVDDVVTKTINDLRINYNDDELPNGYAVQLPEGSPNTIDVVVKGSREAIENIDPSKITVYVDLKDITTVGRHKVSVTVTGPDDTISYKSRVSEIEIDVYKK